MKNPNTSFAKALTELQARWFSPDYPNGEPRFQFVPFFRDIAMFVIFPAICVLMANSGKGGKTSRTATHSAIRRVTSETEILPAQIVSFDGLKPQTSSGVAGRKAPGTLVRVRLLNLAESLSEIPVQVRILDYGLGAAFYGGVLLGSGSPDANFSRVNVKFNFAKRRGDEANAYPISARALSLNGTIGLNAEKKEGVFARGALSGASNALGSLGAPAAQGGSLQVLLLQALTSGLGKEVGGHLGVVRNQADVLSVLPGREFFVELTDFFPGRVH